MMVESQVRRKVAGVREPICQAPHELTHYHLSSPLSGDQAVRGVKVRASTVFLDQVHIKGAALRPRQIRGCHTAVSYWALLSWGKLTGSESLVVELEVVQNHKCLKNVRLPIASSRAESASSMMLGNSTLHGLDAA